MQTRNIAKRGRFVSGGFRRIQNACTFCEEILLQQFRAETVPAVAGVIFKFVAPNSMAHVLVAGFRGTL